jgi:hypothetical protein
MTEPKKEPRKSKVTLQQVLAAIEADDNLGFCLACGAEAYCVEPDARKYECESCGEHKVYGAEELLLMGIGI